MEAQRHGGGLDCAIAHYGGRKEDWLDLSTGINPNAYPVPDVPSELWQRLPDESVIADCLAAARAYYNVPDRAAIVAAPGTQAIIQHLPSVLPTKKVAIVTPTYNEYAACYERTGAEIIQSVSIEHAIENAQSVIIGNPNNPDGRYVSAAGLECAKSHDRHLIIDEAFGDIAPESSAVSKVGDANILVLKSFGKFFGLAGLRLGFAIGAPGIINRFQTALGPWAVSGPALYIGTKAMSDRTWIEAARINLRAERQRLEGLLISHGFSLIGATDLFVTVSHIDSENIFKSLAGNHILLRGFDYEKKWLRFGLPGDDGQFARLEKALNTAILTL